MRFSQDYFEHTMDMDFLREYGYPFLKPQAEFYADYIVLLVSTPSELQKMIDEAETFCRQWRIG